jgi:hypothetical protein
MTGIRPIKSHKKMFGDDYYLPSPQPFWFASEELLTKVLSAEIEAVTQLLAKYPDLRNLFDAPEATVPQRTACFVLLAHRKVMETIYETFAGRHDQSPSLGDVESHALSRTNNLVIADAPAWVLEVNEVVQRLPSHIYNALPEPLRLGGFNASNPEKAATIKSAAETLSSVEQVRVLTGGVLDQQLRRLAARWSPTTTINSQSSPDQSPVEIISAISIRETPQPKKRKALRTKDKVRELRDKMIAEIDQAARANVEFIRMMDERKVLPLPTWRGWPGTWVEAYRNPHLRTLIHKDKSRSIKRALTRRNG